MTPPHTPSPPVATLHLANLDFERHARLGRGSQHALHRNIRLHLWRLQHRPRRRLLRVPLLAPRPLTHHLVSHKVHHHLWESERDFFKGFFQGTWPKDGVGKGSGKKLCQIFSISLKLCVVTFFKPCSVVWLFMSEQGCGSRVSVNRVWHNANMVVHEWDPRAPHKVGMEEHAHAQKCTPKHKCGDTAPALDSVGDTH